MLEIGSAAKRAARRGASPTGTADVASFVTVLTVPWSAGDRWVDVHLVIPETYPGVLYPTNALRSLAEQWVLTEWMFVLDADLVPNAAAGVFDQVLRDAHAGYIPEWREQELRVRFPTPSSTADEPRLRVGRLELRGSSRRNDNNGFPARKIHLLRSSVLRARVEPSRSWARHSGIGARAKRGCLRLPSRHWNGTERP